MNSTKHCGGCGAELSAEEFHYYGYSCERCERADYCEPTEADQLRERIRELEGALRDIAPLLDLIGPALRQLHQPESAAAMDRCSERVQDALATPRPTAGE